MADRRKLQGEIDRCLKKVVEGVATFEEIWDKVHNATNANQKDKYESDLKKEIKKLQRLRDQIKTWLTSNEIKDKRALTENRKLIETQMERFKVVERETKTKAYSKEGLGSVQKMDPVQKEKEEVSNWLSNTIDTLTVQVDQFESEIEALQIGQKKNKKDREKQNKHDKLKKLLESHRYHINQLETILRMLNNETVTVDQVKSIRDMMEYYTECNLDDELPELESIYSDLDIEAFRANNLGDVLNPLAKSSSTSSNSKQDSSSNVSGSNDVGSAAVSSSVGSTSKENDDTNAHSHFSSSANESAPSEVSSASGHSSSSKSTASVITNNVPSSVTTTTSSDESRSTPAAVSNNTAAGSTSLPSTTPPAAASVVSTVAAPVVTLPSSKTVWSAVNNSAAPATRTGSSTTNAFPAATVSPISNAGPYAAMASTSVPSKEDADPRTLANTDTGSGNRSLTTPPATLYSAAAAGSTVDQTPTNRPLSNNTPSGIDAQVTQLQSLHRQQQQQPNSQIYNGFKEEHNVPSLKAQAQQVLTPGGDHASGAGGGGGENNLILERLMGLKLGNVASGNNIGQANVSVVDPSNSVPSINANAAQQQQQHGEQTHGMFAKTSLPNNTQMLANNVPPPISVSPKMVNTLLQQQQQQQQQQMPVSGNNISRVEMSPPMPGMMPNAPTSIGNNVVVNHQGSHPGQPQPPHIQQQQQQQQQQANFKNTYSKLYMHMQLLESASRHPLLISDSHRLRQLGKLAPQLTVPSRSTFSNMYLPHFNNLEFYQHLSPEILFFVFYYMEGTKAQYMAAKTLKNKSWRFHTKFLTWFQRLEEPKLISDDYEQGTYIFFDFERWQQRRREGFIFEYKYLEDKDLN